MGGSSPRLDFLDYAELKEEFFVQIKRGAAQESVCQHLATREPPATKRDYSRSKKYRTLWTPIKDISPATVSFRSDWISNVQTQLSLSTDSSSTDSSIRLASFTFPRDICLAI